MLSINDGEAVYDQNLTLLWEKDSNGKDLESQTIVAENQAR